MSDSVTISRAIRAWVAEGCGLARAKVIPGNDPSPQPAAPYATVTLIGDTPDGLVWTRETLIEDRTYTDGVRTDGMTIDSDAYLSSELALSVQWFGREVYDYARRFVTWASSPAGVSEAARRGLTFYRTGSIRDLSDQEYGRFRDRRQVDLIMGVVWCDTRDTGYAGSIDIDLQHETIGGVVNQVDIEIPTAKQEASA